jgi:hypothetical protein
LVRQFIPKSRRLSTVSDKELAMIQDRLNNRRRKRLGYKTPLEVFSHKFGRVALRAYIQGVFSGEVPMFFLAFKRQLYVSALVSALAPGVASAQSLKAGVLQCHLSGGVGMILMMNQSLDCVFKSQSGGPTSHYIGRLTNVGANIGISGPGRMVWGVLAATNNLAPGALAGDFVGAQGSVAVGAGAGGAVLVGGSNRSISLQPISVSVGTGLNLSAGIGSLNLQYMPVTPSPPFPRLPRAAW